MPPADGRLGVVADLWRFPVKSFGGERLRSVFVGPFGLLGDRRYALTNGTRTLTARRSPALLGFSAGYADGAAAERPVVTTVDGQAFDPDDGELIARIVAAVPEASAIASGPLGFFDAAPLHILGEPSIAALAERVGDELDRRRFRANILVEPAGGAAFEEDGWIGRRIGIGDAVAEVVVNTERCAVTTFDPDTRERNPEVLRRLATTRENLFGVYARVVRPGWIAVGDPIRAHAAG